MIGKKTLATLAIGAACLTASAQAQEATGTIIFYRPGTVMGAAVACPIRYQDKEILELARGKYAEWHVPAGQYHFANKVDGVDVTVEAGKTYYVRCTVKVGLLAGRSNLEVVDGSGFRGREADFEKREIVTP